MNMKKLYECEHDYYCQSENYFSNDTVMKYDSFEEFYEEWGDSDFDYNLLFRWDWKIDEETNENELYCHWMQQRKGRYMATITEISIDDEPKVKEFLKERYKHIIELWEPFNL